jgi:hypothetical protein
MPAFAWLCYNPSCGKFHADDLGLIRVAAGLAHDRLKQRLHSFLSPFLVSDAQAFAEQLHPIFMVANVPAHQRVIEAVGCNAQDVVGAISRLLRLGCSRAAEVSFFLWLMKDRSMIRQRKQAGLECPWGRVKHAYRVANRLLLC